MTDVPLPHQARVALVTGSARGMGREHALALSGAGWAGYAHYCTAKAALIGPTRSLAREVAGSGMACYLLFAQAGFVTGQVLQVDGGMVMA